MRARSLAVLASLFAAGCAGSGAYPHDTGTRVDLSRANFRVVRAGATGSDSGFSLLGFLPILPASYGDAMDDLYLRAGLTEGSAFALTNVTRDESNLYVILFSMPRVTIRADVVEFQDPPTSTD